MLLPLSVLPIILLLVQNVIGLDLRRTKRVPEDDQAVKTPYHLNHPPSVDSYIPVTVIYDDEDDIPVQGKVLKEDSESVHVDPNDDKVTSVPAIPIQPKALYANHPPSVEDYNPIAAAIVTDNNEERKAKSINKAEENPNNQTISTSSDNTTEMKNANSNENKLVPRGRSLNLENGSTVTKRPARKQTQRRRRVNKQNKVNKTETIVDKTKNTVEKISQKELTPSKIVETPTNNDQSLRSSKFQRRTEPRDPVVPIVESENYVFAYNGDFHYSYEGGDGTKAFERGELKTVEDGSTGTGVVGGFSYKDKDGNDFSLSYTADENGYRPVGAHLPTPPPIPIAIQRALALLATKTTPEPITERVNKFY